MPEQPQGAWHGTIFSMGDQSYSHLHAAAQAGHVELAVHLSMDHGVTASWDKVGSWCRDVEAHAAAHGVVTHAADGERP